MDAPTTFNFPSMSATASLSRTNEANQQYYSASERSSSSMDEKDSLKQQDSESASTSLLDARELEAQPELHTIPPEDLVPRRTKIIFVALYFFFNLSLTLSNKSVLSRVSALSRTTYI
jgi:hypothetical protein